MTRFTISAGGMTSSGARPAGDLELTATIGQTGTTPVMTGGDIELTGGFLFAIAPGDCTEDGGIDLLDHERFSLCATGPEASLVDPDCVCLDIDGDEDVDLADYAAVQLSFSPP
jgi:hypothetical protein